MSVMTAGIHHANVSALVFTSHCGGIWQASLFHHWQRIHIRTQCDHRAGFPALKQANKPGMRNAGLHLNNQTAQMLRNQRRGA